MSDLRDLKRVRAFLQICIEQLGVSDAVLADLCACRDTVSDAADRIKELEQKNEELREENQRLRRLLVPLGQVLDEHYAATGQTDE